MENIKVGDEFLSGRVLTDGGYPGLFTTKKQFFGIKSGRTIISCMPNTVPEWTTANNEFLKEGFNMVINEEVKPLAKWRVTKVKHKQNKNEL